MRHVSSFEQTANGHRGALKIDLTATEIYLANTMSHYSVQYRVKDQRPGASWVTSQESIAAPSPSHA